MLKRLLSTLCCLCLLLSCATAEENALDEAYRDMFRRFRTTGGAVCIARDGEILYEYDYGYAAKSREPVTSDTYFRIASVTKIISAIRVMQLVEEGTLDLDEDLSTYFGFKVRNPYYPNTVITLRQLMSHTSSIKSEGSESGRTPLSNILTPTQKHMLYYRNVRPGSKYKYSNFGAGLMGSLMEVVTGKNVQDTVAENVFLPLNLDAAYSPTLLKHPENVSSIYSTQGKTLTSRSKLLTRKWDDSVNPEMHYGITIGSMWIRCSDLCRLGIALCDGGTVDGVQLLKPETVATMMADQKGLGGVNCDSPYGLCVNRVDDLLEDRLVYGHQGMGDEFICNLYFEPESRLVFALVTNGCSQIRLNWVGKISRAAFALAWDNFGEK